MKRLLHLFAALTTAVVVAGCAGMHGAPAKTSGGVLTDTSGMTLYVLDNDAANNGKSTCNGPCAANWPPLLAPEGARARGDYSIVKRDDGTLQWAYKGKPLYRWVKDQNPGDKSGEGVMRVWHAAKP